LAPFLLPASGVVAADLEGPSCDFIEDAFEFGVDAGFVDSGGFEVVVDMFRSVDERRSGWLRGDWLFGAALGGVVVASRTGSTAEGRCW